MNHKGTKPQRRLIGPMPDFVSLCLRGKSSAPLLLRVSVPIRHRDETFFETFPSPRKDRP
jgi:hypothetical protein